MYVFIDDLYLSLYVLCVINSHNLITTVVYYNSQSIPVGFPINTEVSENHKMLHLV